MTIKECIDIVDNAKPNQYGIKEKVMWLSFVDETIINDVLKTHEGYDGRFDNFEGYTEDKLSVPLIVPSPYDRLYPQYIKMMIDSENGETARYNNSSALYNTYLNEYKKYYNKTHMPLNATQKIPSPVSININSALSDAQIEYIKRQLYYMLSQDFDEVVSRDKLYDIVTSFVSNNLEMLKTKLAMSYKGETSVLPDNAKTGDVYRIAETIYEKDTIYIPCDGVGIGFGDTYSVDEYTTRVDIGRYSLAEQICSACDSAGKISIVSDMFADNVLYTAEVVDYNVSEGYLDFKNESEAFIAVLLTSERARYIIPDELIERNRLSEYKIANYFKGDCVVYENGTWKKLGNDEIANIYILLNKLMIEIDNKNDSFAETIDSLNEYKVDTDLANVDNEVFKAKAEEAGVGGGDAGLADEKNYMVFKGVVDALPYWANEGEVYKPKSDYLAEKQYNNPDNFHSAIDYIGDNYVVFGGDLFEYFKEAYEKSTTKSGYLMFDNGEYWEEFYFTVENVEGSVVTFANAVQSTLERVFSYPVMYFSIQNVLIVHKGTSAVYHNGEWIPLID